MKKYTLELSEEQLILVSKCLEDISRFASGQCKLNYTLQEMERNLPHDEQINRIHKAEDLLMEVKKILLPDLLENESLGYNSTEFIGNVYQIYRTILYTLNKDLENKNVYSSPALPSGNLGTVKIKVINN